MSTTVAMLRGLSDRVKELMDPRASPHSRERAIQVYEDALRRRAEALLNVVEAAERIANDLKYNGDSIVTDDDRAALFAALAELDKETKK